MYIADNGDGTYTNPILYSDYSDPDAIRVESDFYMIASSFSNAPGLPILHSKNLVDWKLINYALPKIPNKRYDLPVHGCGVWAPSIRYREGLFYICFPTPDEGIFMTTAKDPYGEWSEPVNICPGAGRIDPCPFWDDDGKAYLVTGVAKSRIGYKSVLHIQEMQPDGMGLIGEPVKVFDGNENDQHTIEGPKLYKRNGMYYIFAPAGGVKTGWQTVLRSKNIYGPYEYKVVMRQGNSEVNGPHQGAWIDTLSGENWFIHFQDVYAAGRIVHLQPMKWENDWPIIGKPVADADYGEPVSRHKKPDVGEVSYLIRESDNSKDFSEGRISLKWQWNANPNSSWFDIKDDALHLHAIKKGGAYGDQPNILLQKWPASEFSWTARLSLSKLMQGDEAGMISLGMDYGVISFCHCKSQFFVKVIRGHQIFGRILVEKSEEDCLCLKVLPTESGIVYVRYVVENIGKREINSEDGMFPDNRVTMYYSIDGVNYTPALKMRAVPGRWVGVKFGLFCLSSRSSSSGYVAVDDVFTSY